ncbi:FecR family protein [Tardiphaga sp. 42S5]|uniref:FecR family protein n=1 Tax=Tardiphaga sp. 42S5 TaxID=1404799 RepID=UPI002A5A20E0|nr:FecR domain-containing protein [Tardiphaga sp. 42S5]WPO40278.1 FecR domain-containing protein [Tardiphaga sp. 42S5]
MRDAVWLEKDMTMQSTHELAPLDREAHAWVRRLTSGEATATDADALREWCGRSPAHATAFSAASRLWRQFGPAARVLEDSRAPSDLSARRARTMGRRAFLGGALAASAAGVMLVKPPLDLWPSFAELQADFRTGVGEQRTISVSDGVAIEMNGRTSISVASDAIELITGEASFALPESRPRQFEVVAGNGRASATNARFDIRHIGAHVRVTCFANEVRIEHLDRTMTLGPRQQVSYRADVIEDVLTIDPAVASAWQRGLMIFNMTPLGDVIDELNRYRSGRIVLLDRSLAESPVNGRFKIDRPDDALAQIELAFSVRRRTLPGGLILLG